jgi:tetratricopeptide (TPR) repeat protein
MDMLKKSFMQVWLISFVYLSFMHAPTIGNTVEINGIESSGYPSTEYDPAAAEAQMLGEKALTAMKQKNYSTAIDLLEKAMELDPENYGCKNDLAIAFRNAGRYDEAENFLKEAMRLDSDQDQIKLFAETLVGIYLHHGRMLEKQACFGKATEEYVKAYTLSLSNNVDEMLVPLIHRDMAYAYYRSGNREKAVQEAERALASMREIADKESKKNNRDQELIDLLFVRFFEQQLVLLQE